MDAFTPRLLEAGLRAMIGKGERSAAVREAIIKHKEVYFVATGGAAALITKSIKKSETVAYEDLGAEALLKLTVEDFPAIVANDIYGGDIFEQAKAQYRRLE
jgi:fumarate hydratase subunit beta